MRLLKLQDDGGFSLVERVGRDIPRYAILSHTWGADHDEVTFKDIVEGTGKEKSGYSKIRFCAKQAAYDGLQFIWVDTCSIDKSSSAELSEAINSMFRWYRDAAKCYVYLSDVSIPGSVGNARFSRQMWKQAFQQSRWFTRGWTLQELLAPISVEFFSAEGTLLGEKKSMVQEIHDITGISARALEGSSLSQFSINERMSWAERRETKREEDAAYSLLGIFDTHIPLIYGEGREKAFVRLRKEIEVSTSDESHALPQAFVECSKCGELGHYASAPHCYKCGKYGHYANEPHCYKCGEYGHISTDQHCYKCNEHGHYANEPHCYRCKSGSHLVRDCPV